MADLLEALGWRVSVGRRICLAALVCIPTVAILAGPLVFAASVGAPPVLVQAAIWAAWLVWLGIIFPHNARRDSETPCEWPYRRAFTREILLGIVVAFSQFLRPAVTGVSAGSSIASGAALAIGVSLLL